jgi:hypothetical protein
VRRNDATHVTVIYKPTLQLCDLQWSQYRSEIVRGASFPSTSRAPRLRFSLTALSSRPINRDGGRGIVATIAPSGTYAAYCTTYVRQTTPVSGLGGRGRPRWDIRLASVLLGVGFSYRTEERNPQDIASIIEPILGLRQYSAVSTSAEVYKLHDHGKVNGRLRLVMKRCTLCQHASAFHVVFLCVRRLM